MGTLDMSGRYVLFSSELSPFGLKIALGLQNKGVAFRWSHQCSSLDRISQEVRVQCIKRRWVRLDIPNDFDPKLDEFPLVPYLLGEDGTNCYDSHSIVASLGFNSQVSEADKFLSLLLEKFFDEWGLYVVHHMRWTDPGNCEVWNGEVKHPEKGPGGLLAFYEYENVWLPRFVRLSAAQWFNARQTKRLPYFLSVGNDKTEQAEVFLPTRRLLDKSFERIAKAAEMIFSDSNAQSIFYSRGINTLTPADLAIFGQFNMLAHFDRGSRKRIGQMAPNFLSWMDTHQRNINVHCKQTPYSIMATPVEASERKHVSTADPEKGLKMLLKEVGDTFVPLQVANKLAFEAYRELGVSEFNESAMWNRRSLFKSSILGVPYVMVAKSFQYKSWIKIMKEFDELSDASRQDIYSLGFDIVAEKNVSMDLLSHPMTSQL